ncbi:MAG: hypothetical protein Q4C33_02565 [bacterium]|nr:hypothetical protein [bacterium]
MGSKIEIYTNYIENCLFTYFKYLLGKTYKYSIVKIFITKYIEVRYYNNAIYRDKNLSDKLGKEFKLIAKELMKEDDSDSELIKNICALFGYVLYFDDACEYTDLNILIDSLFEETYVLADTDIKPEFTNFIKETITKKEAYHKLFTTKEFDLKYKRYKKNVYKVTIENNIDVGKLYSDYAKEKAFNEGTINEDKNYVLIRILSEKLLQDAIKSDFTQKYIIELPETFFAKPKKYKKLISMLDNDLIRSRINLKITYEEYMNHKEIINESINLGISFALELDETFDNSFNTLVLFKYVIVYEHLDCYDALTEDKNAFGTTIITL